MDKNVDSAKVLGLIPAKGTSEGLPGKNMAVMFGFPMIHYILSGALAASTIDDVWVSTENADIEAFCAESGAKVLRHDPALSSDSSPTFGVVRNMLDYWHSLNLKPDVVVTMRATSPLCLAQDIDTGVRLLLESEADSVVAVSRSDIHPHRILEINNDGYLVHFDKSSPETDFPIRRQELSPVYIRAGAFYATRAEVIINGSLWGQYALPHILPKERSVNVNDAVDFSVAEQLLIQRDPRSA